MTVKSLPICTISSSPAAVTRWASYTPSESVSTRWIVAPGYAASAASVTLVASAPVSICSSGRWLCDWSTVLATVLTAVDAAFAAVSFTRRVRPARRLRRPPSS